jgi:hypothetical protein
MTCPPATIDDKFAQTFVIRKVMLAEGPGAANDIP